MLAEITVAMYLFIADCISPIKVVSAGQARTSDDRYGQVVALVHAIPVDYLEVVWQIHTPIVYSFTVVSVLSCVTHW